MLQAHTPGAKLLRVYQRFNGYTSSPGAEFPPRKMLHDTQQVKCFGASSWGKLSELENACKMSLEHAPGAKPLVCIGLRLRAAKVRFAQSEFKILRVLYNLSERKKKEPL